jgi:hypothetical protein
MHLFMPESERLNAYNSLISYYLLASELESKGEEASKLNFEGRELF